MDTAFNDILELIRNSWQVVIIVATALGVGYTLAKRLNDLIGKDSAGRTVTERLERVEYQLWPNNGKSLSDKVTNLQEGQVELKEQLGKIEGETEVIKSMLSALVSKK